MRTVLASYFTRSKRPLFVSSLLFMFLGLLFVLAVGNTAALAAPVSASSTANQHFSKQMRIGFQAGDDWEPAIAVDRYGHTYALYKHYDVSGGQTCSGCDLHLLVQRSSDDGQSWTKPRPIAPGTVKGGQYDSQIMVDPVDGRTVWASFLQNSNSLIAVVKSTDFGETWSAPMLVSSRPPGLDKDELAVRGNTIVVAYDDNFNTWMSISLNGGKSWTTHEVFPTSFLFSISLSAGAAIDSQGNIFISWDSFDKEHRKLGNGPSTLWVSKSSDNGNSWSRKIIDTSGAPPPCNNCGYSFLGAQMALRVGTDDTIYLLWNGTVSLKNFAPERIFFSRSTDHGNSYSPRVGISDASDGVEHAFPALATGNSSGDVRLAWMDKRIGAWNVFYRSSADGGEDFSGTVRISGFVPGYSYLTTAGFGSPYGDYMSMVVSNDNTVQMAFGEGPSYQGPGNIWVAHSVDD